MRRRMGDAKAADEWDAGIRKTSQLAEREGWHGVRHWHHKFGLPSKGRAAKSLRHIERGGASGLLLALGALLVLALVAWFTR